ncbi:hypothetical protein ACN47A_02050 [Myxococcus fulvus]|uniref:hypothetical protein n=1 Tax=Myxococcus fulvus TaxID=33 RepID=UPI003B9CB577
MRRLRPLLACLCGLLASRVWAQPPARSLGVTVFPVGAYVLSDTEGGREAGYSAGLAWSYRREASFLEVGGHVASSRQLTEATPMSLRITPPGPRRVRPYLGLGLSLMVAHAPREEGATRALQLGAELCGGFDVELGRGLFLSAEARYQNFSATGSPFAGARQALSSGFLGLGMHL